MSSIRDHANLLTKFVGKLEKLLEFFKEQGQSPVLTDALLIVGFLAKTLNNPSKWEVLEKLIVVIQHIEHSEALDAIEVTEDTEEGEEEELY